MTRIFVNDGKCGVLPSGDKAQPAAGNMHPADVMHLASDHAWTVSGNGSAQIGHRHHQSMLGQQAIDPQPAAPVAAIAGDVHHWSDRWRPSQRGRP